MKSKTTKTIVVTVIVLLVVLSVSAVFFSTRTSQNHIQTERQNGIVGEMFIDYKNQSVILRPCLRFKFDTGADFSSITEEDLKGLDSLGYKVTESTYPIFGRDGKGDLRFETKRYTVELPLYQWDVSTDSVGNTKAKCLFSKVNVLKSVDFAPSRTGFSVLGMDFIEKFIVEHRAKEGLVALYFEEPTGYEPGGKIYKSISPIHWITLSHRYYINLTINNDTRGYFLDTGIRQAFVKRPKSALPLELNKALLDTVSSYRGAFPAIINPNGWLAIGNRQGKTPVFYYDDDEEDYAINPLNIINDIDMLFDFPHKSLKFRK